MLNSVSSAPMRYAYKSIKADSFADIKKPRKDNASATNSFASVSSAIYKMPTALSDTSKYQQALNNLASAIVSKRYDDMDGLFTAEAKDIYNRLIKYGRAKIVGIPSFSFYQNGDNVIARGLQMSFSLNQG